MAEDKKKKEMVHIVTYNAYSKNPNAVGMMQKAAERFLTKAKGQSKIIFGKPFDNRRAVGKSDYDFAIIAIFPSKDALNIYMKDDNHMGWVEFVLNGYQVPESKLKTLKERKAEFIQKVLYGSEKFRWMRDSDVPDSEVVWGGEVVRDLS